jgi:hypothetical protein
MVRLTRAWQIRCPVRKYRIECLLPVVNWCLELLGLERFQCVALVRVETILIVQSNSQGLTSHCQNKMILNFTLWKN